MKISSRERRAMGLSRFCVQCGSRPDNHVDDRCDDCRKHPGPVRFNGDTGARINDPGPVTRPLLGSQGFELGDGCRQVH